MPNGELLLLTLLHLAMTALPMAAAALLAARAGVRSVPVLLAVALAIGALAGYGSFWAYFGGRTLGEAATYLLLIGSIWAIAWSLWGGRLERRLLRALAIPLALWALASVFLLFFGFAHDGTAEPITASLSRFSHTLPSDSQIPFFYSEWFFANGHHGQVPIFPGEWQFSDRPPLQVGYTLSQRPIDYGGTELSYQVLGVMLQQLWVIGLYALLLAARVRPLTRGLILVAVLVSDLALVNGFFVWPKMLPAALLVAMAALILTPVWEQVRGNLWGAALVAALAGLAMLGHGSSVFGVIPLLVVAAFRGLPSWRWLAVAVGVGAVLMGSWSAFQKYEDPPGNRLAKWTLAGVPEVDDRGTLETVADAYSEAGLGNVLHYKAQNVVTIFGGAPMVLSLKATVEGGELNQIGRALRGIQFFNLVPGFGLLLLGPLLMAVGWKRRGEQPEEWNLALLCFAVFAIGTAIWVLLVFGNGIDRTLKHISSYLLPLLGIVGCVSGLRAVFPRFGLVYVAVASALSLALYAPALDPLPGTSYSPVAIAIAVLALAGFVFLALSGRERPPRPPAAAAEVSAAAAAPS